MEVLPSISKKLCGRVYVSPPPYSLQQLLFDMSQCKKNTLHCVLHLWLTYLYYVQLLAYWNQSQHVVFLPPITASKFKIQKISKNHIRK